MRNLKMIPALCLSLFGGTSAASAALVTQVVSTTISPQTIDTLGLFGPKGGDLSGKPMNIRFQYKTENFDLPPATCNPPTPVAEKLAPTSSSAKRFSTTQLSCLYYSSAGLSDGLGSLTLVDSILIVVDVDGVVASFVSAAQGGLEIDNEVSPPNLFLDVNIQPAPGFPLCYVNIAYQKPIKFGGALYPPNNYPVLGVIDNIGLHPALGDALSESISFTVQGAGP